MMLIVGLVGAVMSSRAEASSIVDGCPDVIVEKFGDQAESACYVAWRESSWNPWATGALGERGWYQIHPVHGALSSYDPYVNVEAAWLLSEGGTNWCRHWRWVC